MFFLIQRFTQILRVQYSIAFKTLKLVQYLQTIVQVLWFTIVPLALCCRVLSEQNERFSHFAAVGVNTFVTVQLSFLPESERRCTRIAARTFCPEFDHHMEVCCDLLVQRSSGETCSLAEQLEEASAVFTVWNRENCKGLRNIFYASSNCVTNFNWQCFFVSPAHPFKNKCIYNVQYRMNE